VPLWRLADPLQRLEHTLPDTSMSEYGPSPLLFSLAYRLRRVESRYVVIRGRPTAASPADEVTAVATGARQSRAQVVLLGVSP
jgi:hypothetical protein